MVWCTVCPQVRCAQPPPRESDIAKASSLGESPQQPWNHKLSQSEPIDNCGLGTALWPMSSTGKPVLDTCCLPSHTVSLRKGLHCPCLPWRLTRVACLSAHLLPATAGPGTLELTQERGSLSFLQLASCVARTLLQGRGSGAPSGQT